MLEMRKYVWRNTRLVRSIWAETQQGKGVFGSNIFEKVTGL